MAGGEIQVRIIPSLLRDCTGGKAEVRVEGATLRDALASLRERYPLLAVHLYDESGEVRPHVLIYYNDENIRWLERLDTPIREGDEITIFQAVSGGSG